MNAISHVGPRFEAFGQRFMDFVVKEKLVHRGLNEDGHPVGYTVDSFSDTGKTVAEYSATKDYFSGRLDKPVNDLLHAVRLHGGVEDIYLVASASASTSDIREFKNRVADWPGFAYRTIHVYDQRRIAEEIADEMLANDLAIDELAEFLPELKRICAEHSANMLAPTQDPRYLARADVDTAISDWLETHKCLVISGIGGSGKSEAAAAYASRSRKQFEIVIWLQGSEVQDVSGLRAARLGRRGDQYNVAGLLSTRKSLVVIDDAEAVFDIAELEAICSEESRVIITQRSSAGASLSLPLMRADLAREVLERDLPSVSPAAVWERVWKTVGGHPLTLALMNAAVRGGATWEDIGSDCAFVGELEDDQMQRLADRLLGRLRTSLRRELGIFVWLDSTVADRGFLKSVIGPVGVRKLEAHSLTTADRALAVRIHDIVLASMRQEKWFDEEELSRLNDELERYLVGEFESSGVTLRAAGIALNPKLKALCTAGDKRPVYLYALLQVWNETDLDRALLGDPAQTVQALEQGKIPVSAVAIAVVLEAIECMYRSDKAHRGLENARATLRARLPLFERLQQLQGVPPRQKIEIIHHHAKALVVLEKLDEARLLFEQVLASAFPLYESRLQLVRIFSRQKRHREAVEQAEIILKAAQQQGEVSYSVTLAALEAVPSGDERERLIKAYADTVERELLLAADAGLEQVLQVASAVGRSWSWNDPERFKRVWRKLPSSQLVLDRSKFIQAELHQLAARVMPDEVRQLTENALRLFDEMTERDDFQSQKYGQCLVEAGQPGKAIGVLDTIENKGPFVSYWMSKACLDGGDIARARTEIDLALEKLHAEKERFQNTYFSAFLAQRFEVRVRQGDLSARDDILAAIEKTSDGKYRATLERRLSQYDQGHHDCHGSV